MSTLRFFGDELSSPLSTISETIEFIMRNGKLSTAGMQNETRLRLVRLDFTIWNT